MSFFWGPDVVFSGDVTDDEVDPLRCYGPEDVAVREEEKKPREEDGDEDSETSSGESGDEEEGDFEGGEGDEQLDIPPVDADVEEAC